MSLSIGLYKLEISKRVIDEEYDCSGLCDSICKTLANLGYPGYFEDKDINPIIENAMNTNTKNHDFFSVKGDGYVVSMNVESIEDEDFIFE